MMLICSLLIPLLQGYFLISLFLPQRTANIYLVLIKLFLSIGMGFGFSSCYYFIWILFFPPQNQGIIILDIFILLLLLIGLLHFRNRKNTFSNNVNNIKESPQWFIDTFLLIVFLFVLIIDILVFLHLSLRSPHGEWDAWAIWNMHARFIFRSNDLWKITYPRILAFFAPDYPLLIPLSIVKSWCYSGQESKLLVSALHFLFTFSTIGLILASLSLLRSKGQGYLAGLVLLGTPFLITQGASQYADVPLSYFFLATLVIISLKDMLFTRNNHVILLSGIMAGFAAWTKNEGILFLTLFMVARLIIYWKHLFTNSKLNEVLYLLAGISPIVFLIVIFKINYAPSNDIVSLHRADNIIISLMNYPKYVMVFKAFTFYIINFGQSISNFIFFKLKIMLPVFLIIYLLITGIDWKREMFKIYLFYSLLLILLGIGYIVIYVISPHDLDWHIKSSLDRILLQMYPSFMVYYFLIARTPEELFLYKK